MYTSGTPNNDVLNTGDDEDNINFSQGGSDIVNAGGNADIIIGGAAFDASDQIDGGGPDSWYGDTLVLAGDYSAGIVFNSTTLRNVEQIEFNQGSAAGLHDGNYNLTTHDDTVGAGRTLIIDAMLLALGQHARVDGSAETDGHFEYYGGYGHDVFIGGAQGDTFYSGGGGIETALGGGGDDFFFISGDQFSLECHLTAADTVDGGTGYDVLHLSGNFPTQVTLDASTFTNIEELRFQPGGQTPFAYKLATHDGNVAAGKTLYVNAWDLDLMHYDDPIAGGWLEFDGSAETDGNFSFQDGMLDDLIRGSQNGDVFYSRGGADTFFGNDGGDYFGMQAAFDRHDRIYGGAGYDIVNLNGNYAHGVNLDDQSLIAVEAMRFSAGHDYNVRFRDANVAPGQTFDVDGSLLGPNDMLIFDGSSETDGGFNIVSGAGADTLIGGAGDDLVTGGLGNDTFVYRGGADIIADFVEGAGGIDRIGLAKGLGAHFLSDVLALATQAGADTVIDFGNGNTLTLQNVLKTSLVSSDFVFDVGTAPLIISNGGGPSVIVPVSENTTDVTTVHAIDSDAGTTLSYSIIGGADANKFSIDASSGALSFLTPQDFETPADQGGDNDYQVQVRVTDGVLFDTQSLTVRITNAFEPFNHAPINHVPALASIETNKDQPIGGFSISDVDAPWPHVLTTTLSVAHGTLTVGWSFGMAAVQGSGTSTVTLTGMIQEINTSLGWAGNVVYRAAQDYTGSETFTITTNDNGNSGIGGPMSDTDQVTINIVPSAAAADPWLIGTPGDDSYVALPGNERIDALGGNDTIAFNFALVDATVTYSDNQVIVDSVSSHTVLTGFETYVFTDGTVSNNDANALVDDLFYYSRNHDVWIAQVEAETHYDTWGWQELRDPNAFFDTSGYLAVNPDVAAACTNPLDHYHQTGWHEGRDPSVWFDTTLYLAQNPDVAAADIDPLAHYLANGMAEGRVAHEAVGPVSNGFDAQYYLFHNPDVAAAGVDPLLHFNAIGWQEGRNPNAWFDTAGYLAHNPDVAAASINPLQHYETVGWTEGRDPSAQFDTLGYLAANPDVAAAHFNPLDHFLQAGIYEGRMAINDGMWS
jgi:hypothetical protein